MSQKNKTEMQRSLESDHTMLQGMQTVFNKHKQFYIIIHVQHLILKFYH